MKKKIRSKFFLHILKNYSDFVYNYDQHLIPTKVFSLGFTRDYPKYLKDYKNCNDAIKYIYLKSFILHNYSYGWSYSCRDNPYRYHKICNTKVALCAFMESIEYAINEMVENEIRFSGNNYDLNNDRISVCINEILNDALYNPDIKLDENILEKVNITF